MIFMHIVISVYDNSKKARYVYEFGMPALDGNIFWIYVRIFVHIG